MAHSKRFLLKVVGGGVGGTVYSQQSVVCMEEKKLAGVCFALVKRGASMKQKEFRK